MESALLAALFEISASQKVLTSDMSLVVQFQKLLSFSPFLFFGGGSEFLFVYLEQRSLVAQPGTGLSECDVPPRKWLTSGSN